MDYPELVKMLGLSSQAPKKPKLQLAARKDLDKEKTVDIQAIRGGYLDAIFKLESELCSYQIQLFSYKRKILSSTILGSLSLFSFIVFFAVCIAIDNTEALIWIFFPAAAGSAFLAYFFFMRRKMLINNDTSHLNRKIRENGEIIQYLQDKMARLTEDS